MAGGGRFPIRCRYQENRGKHVAYNHAVTLDSDDACVLQALERFYAKARRLVA